MQTKNDEKKNKKTENDSKKTKRFTEIQVLKKDLT